MRVECGNTNQKCNVCNADISYAGSAYCDGVNGDICSSCKIVKSGDRDDHSYISTLEPILNSNGMIIEVQN